MNDERSQPELGPIEREREKMLLLSQQLRSSRQLCPKCGQPTLERVKLAWYLKPLRLFRPVRAYSCINCGHLALLSNDPHSGRTRRKKR
jgi:predicted RNA-binding Zn-ribbon protein involved in translation (DUF1610 family)